MELIIGLHAFYSITGLAIDIAQWEKMQNKNALVADSVWVGHAPLLGYALFDNCIGRLHANFQVSATLSKKVLIFLPY